MGEEHAAMPSLGIGAWHGDWLVIYSSSHFLWLICIKDVKSARQLISSLSSIDFRSQRYLPEGGGIRGSGLLSFFLFGSLYSTETSVPEECNHFTYTASGDYHSLDLWYSEARHPEGIMSLSLPLTQAVYQV